MPHSAGCAAPFPEVYRQKSVTFAVPERQSRLHIYGPGPDQGGSLVSYAPVGAINAGNIQELCRGQCLVNARLLTAAPVCKMQVRFCRAV